MKLAISSKEKEFSSNQKEITRKLWNLLVNKRKELGTKNGNN